MVKRDPKNTFRYRLLSQDTYSDELFKTYRERVEKMIKKETRALQIEKWITRPLWIYIALLCTAFLLIGGYSEDATIKLWFGIVACFCFIFGATFLLKHLINCNRVEMLKQMKEIQLQIMELQEKIENRSSE